MNIHAPSAGAPVGMPPAAPLSTPTQHLDAVPARGPTPASRRVLAARVVAFGGTLLLTALGAYEMAMVVSAGGVTVLEAAMTALFVVTFAWIAFSASSALAGLVAPPRRRDIAALQDRKLKSKTALVMPIYHEDPIETTKALGEIARGLAEGGQAGAFEIVILSDSTGADAWVAETVAVDRLSASLAGLMPVWYRRRWSNHAKKAGNIRQFVETWGSRYDHFVVLDADSLMAPATLVALAAAMEDDPELGLLQTVPVLAGGRTLFARLQQFAGRLYGPVIARGLAAWQGEDGNYWGHNAIVRMAAFAACCGLPELPGRPPLGGSILSHDFVEAAMLRRARWKVEMATDLGGSWEDGPPSLVDAAARDRRWAQGNLQHLKVIGARGLKWPSRVHLALGVMSYCASPIWLLLILLGFALAVQAALVEPQYFSDSPQLFPTWPLFDSERMVRLFLITMAVLLFPKALGLARALALPAFRRECGGGLRLCAGAVVELLLSALYAPVMMLIHTRNILAILFGGNAGWSTQRRGGSLMRWDEAWRAHGWHCAIGVAAAVGTWSLAPGILPWLAPTLAGLVVAAPMSRWSGSTRIGDRLARAGVLLIPEDRPASAGFRPGSHLPSDSAAVPRDAILALATDPTVRAAHYRWASPPPRQRGAPNAANLTANQKIAEAETLNEVLDWLDAGERVQIAGEIALVERLSRLPAKAEPAVIPAPASSTVATPAAIPEAGRDEPDLSPAYS